MTAALLKKLFPTDRQHVAGFQAEVASLLPPQGRLLDLGCGINIDLAAYRSADREVWGSDFQAHPQLQHAEWFRKLGKDGTIPFPDDHFDLVAAIMVFEHVAHPRTFLREVARVLRPGGCCIGHTISGSHYVTWLRRFIGLLPHSLNQLLVRRLYGRLDEDTFPAHYRLNRENSLRSACRAAGLQLVRLQRYADPGYFRFWPPLQSGAILADWSLERLAPGWGRLYFTAVLKKESGANLLTRSQAA